MKLIKSRAIYITTIYDKKPTASARFETIQIDDKTTIRWGLPRNLRLSCPTRCDSSQLEAVARKKSDMKLNTRKCIRGCCIFHALASTPTRRGKILSPSWHTCTGWSTHNSHYTNRDVRFANIFRRNKLNRVGTRANRKYSDWVQTERVTDKEIMLRKNWSASLKISSKLVSNKKRNKDDEI